MNSPTILLLLSAFIGLSSGIIYFRKEHIEKAQTQANLIVFAHNEKNIGLLYKLIPFGQDIDRYLADHSNQLKVYIGQAKEYADGVIRAIAFVIEGSGDDKKYYRAELTMTKSPSSPTGYIMSKGYICHNACQLRDEPRGFF